MNNSTHPPTELAQLLHGEPTDFVVKSTRDVPTKKAVRNILMALFVIGFTVFITLPVVWPVLQGGEAHMTVNGAAVTASKDNLSPLMFPALFAGLFFAIGVFLLISSIRTFMSDGPWLAGTKTRLLIYKKGHVRSLDWEEFSGSITITGTATNGSLDLQLRTGKTERSGKHAEKFVPDVIHIVEIANAFAIEPIIRQRIKENDATPSVTTH